jgi:hypothetical protein
MFGRKDSTDWQCVAKSLAKFLGTKRLAEARDGNYITAEQFKTLDEVNPWIPPAWSQATATPANIQRRAPRMIKLWKSIRMSQRASPESAPVQEGGWFTANR